jgi:beta-D-xylosidase 4
MRGAQWLFFSAVLGAGDASAASYASGVCDSATIAGLPFCDSALPLDERVQDLLARIPLSAAAGLLVDNSSAVPSLGLPSYQWWNEALHGVARSPGVAWREPTPVATSFPQVISTAASFNRSLFHQIAEAISTEGRAFYNSDTAGLTFWTPNVNIYRDPRWGRGQETPGEDPFLTGEYAVAFVRGLQGEEMESDAQETTKPKFLKASGCCKHFSSYSQEEPRHRNDAIVTQQDQADTYFPAFEDCVKRGHVSSIMCSYNAVNGIPSCADKGLLTDLVRTKWKFDGYIASDCAAVADVIYEHHYTQSPERTCATTLSAGMDLNCGEFLRQHLDSALAQGVVSKEMVYTALGNMFRVKMRLGMFEKGGQPFNTITPDSIDTPAHKQLALEAAQQGIVLLKNEDKTLPLDASAFASANGPSIALVGPHFNASDTFLGNYNGTPSHIVTPVEGVSKYAGNVKFSLGCRVAGDVIPDFDEAIKVAAAADRVVAFVGLDQTQEREEVDRYHLKLPGFQKALLDRILSAAKKPIVIVVISGGSVDLSLYKDHPKVGAIVFAGYLGQAGGQAIADVLFGEYNPSGRLTQTFYTAEYTQVMSMYDMNMRPTLATGNPGRTYRFYTGPPVYTFGYGLSYSDFSLAWQAQAPPSVADTFTLSRNLQKEQELDVNTCAVQTNVVVKNEGSMAGRHTVLVYAVPPQAGTNGRPVKSLVGFEVTPVLAPAQQTELQFCLRSKAFALANEDGDVKVATGTWSLHIGDLRHEIEVKSTFAAADDLIAAREFEPLN